MKKPGLFVITLLFSITVFADIHGIKGGLVVCIGADTLESVSNDWKTPGYVFQCLETSPEKVSNLRKKIEDAGCYGKVSVNTFDGQSLPYADNLVNLLIQGSKSDVQNSELKRVLAPNGVAGTRGKKIVKPVPSAIDEWSHFLHGPDNNAVAQDTVAGPPRRLQWTAGPPWCRSHEFISSFCAMVTSGGRVFYVFDEGQPGVTDERMPERWFLIARDAFNGTLLWKKPLPEWRSDEWKGTSMRGRPPSIPRRIVAGGDYLYATLSHNAPLSVIDAATGKILTDIEGTEGTQEIALIGNTLVLRINEAIAAAGAKTGKLLWRKDEKGYAAQTLAAATGRVAYFSGKETVCLSLADGKELWRAADSQPTAEEPEKTANKKKSKKAKIETFVLYGDLMLVTDGQKIIARDAATGKLLWTAKTGGKDMRTSDFYVAQNLVWHSADEGIAGYDLKTGELAKVIDPSSVQSVGHHLRCYRGKATENFIISQFRGTEFISLDSANHSQNDWVRGACSYGIMPANGMLYTPPNQCFCYGGAMMQGLCAFTTASDESMHNLEPKNILEKGPAYGNLKSETGNLKPSDWPLYRKTVRRTGATDSPVDAKVSKDWEAQLEGTLTPPVAGFGKVFVSAKDRNTVYALDAKTGNTAWRFIAGAGVDSPPTLHEGSVLFGSADGWVYCLRASDGELAWRFRAAPADWMMMDENRVESAWRVHGSVIIENGILYCAAGRSSFLDGGIYLYGLNPATGEVIHQNRLDTLSPTRTDAEGQPFLASFHIEGVRSDILVAEGGNIFLNQMQFTPDLKQVDNPYVEHSEADQAEGLDIAKADYVEDNPYFEKDYDNLAAHGVSRGQLGDREVGLHMFTTGGFLDDSWWNRTFWMYSNTWPGYQMANLAPKAGQLLSVGDEMTYAVQAYPSRNNHSPMFTPGARGYLLIADRNDNEPMLDRRSWSRDKGMGFVRADEPEWFRWLPVRMRSMVLAGDNLFVAGDPDVLDELDPMAAFEGRKGAVLLALDAATGKTLAEQTLDAAPVFDGLIAANGNLYMVTTDGAVQCFK